MNNLSLMALEVAVASLGLVLLLVDLWANLPKRAMGYAAAAGVALVLASSFFIDDTTARHAFGTSYVLDGFALFSKRFFLTAAILVLVLSAEFAERLETSVSEYYSLLLFALSGMMLAASANDFVVMFVALELITITFYILASFQRRKASSLEAGLKYLILGALASAFLIYGIALIFGASNTTNFETLARSARSLTAQPMFALGILLLLIGLGFKIAAFPFQVWAPDVYQGAPTPTTAFLAVGSKAAGFVLLLRILTNALPDAGVVWTNVLITVAAVTILYGNLCAIPQRNLKRLLGYSSISHGGYMLLGVAAMSATGSAAVLYYLSGYLFTVLAAFSVICVVMSGMESEDISSLAGLHKRSPLLALAISLSMISLAGVPPLAGFFGKFLLLKAAAEQGSVHPGFYCLIGVAIVGVLISLYYYLSVVKTIYWSEPAEGTAALPVSAPMRFALYACIAGMLYLGLYPGTVLSLTNEAVAALR